LSSTITTLAREWKDIKSILDLVTPPSEFQTQYNELKELVLSINPITVLSPLVPRFTAFKDSYIKLKIEFSEFLNGISYSFSSIISDFKKFLPGELTHEYLKQTIKEAISESFIEPIKKLLEKIGGLIKTTLADIFGQVEDFLKEIIGYLDLRAIIEPINIPINKFKEKVNSLSFSFLEEELKGTFKIIEDKIKEFAPENLLADLDETYKSIINEISSEISPTIFISKLDDIYTRQVLSRVDQLSPEVITVPLEKSFDRFMKPLDEIDVEIIFLSLIKTLNRLVTQLESGLKRTGSTFKGMITAIPI